MQKTPPKMAGLAVQLRIAEGPTFQRPPFDIKHFYYIPKCEQSQITYVLIISH